MTRRIPYFRVEFINLDTKFIYNLRHVKILPYRSDLSKPSLLESRLNETKGLPIARIPPQKPWTFARICGASGALGAKIKYFS